MDVEWNEEALLHQFQEGLSKEVRDKLACFDSPSQLDTCNLTLCIDTQLQERKEEKAAEAKPSVPTLQPMQIVLSGCLTPEERGQ